MEYKNYNEQNVDIENVEVSENLVSQEEFFAGAEFSDFGEENLQSEASGAEVSASASSSSSKSSDTSQKVGTVAVGAVGVFIIAMSVLGTTASIDNISPYGTSAVVDVSTTVEYIVESEAFDYDNFDTGLRLITYSADGEQYFIESLSAGNQNVVSSLEVVETTEDGGTADIDFSVTVSGLYQNTKYTCEIVGEDEYGEVEVYATKSFNTGGLATEFYSVDWLCQCSVDGHFYFWLDFIDENGYYTGFYYRLVSKDTGDVFSEGEINNPEEKQAVYNRNAVGTKYTLEISFASSNPKDVDSGQGEIIYYIDVQF